MFRRWILGAAVVAMISGFIFGCAKSPRTRPLQLAPIDDSLAQVRKQLEGTWDLTSLVIATPDSAAAAVNARGVLVYDSYGNLTIEARVPDAGDGTPNPSGMLSFKGRAVIDEAHKQLKLLDVKGDTGELVPQVSPERTRRYEFDGNVLRLTSVDASGRVTAVATWRKR